METSEQQAKIINLGKQFVSELGLDLDPGVDTLSKWMAHYLAEKITLAEKLEPVEKNAADKECFEIILQLWQHRWLLPQGKRPLEAFEPLLKVLERLDPENTQPLFSRYHERDLFDADNGRGSAKQMASYMAMILKIDKVARTSIEFLLHEAAQSIKSDKIQNLLNNGTGLDDSDDLLIIARVLDNDTAAVDDDIVKKKHKAETLKKRIDDLTKFEELNKFILKKYRDDLAALT